MKCRKQLESKYENGSFCPHCYCRILFDDINEYFIEPNTQANIETDNTCNIDTYKQDSEFYEEKQKNNYNIRGTARLGSFADRCGNFDRQLDT